MIDQFCIKQNESKNGTKTEIVCEVRKQLKLPPPLVIEVLREDKIDSRRKTYNFVETADNISGNITRIESRFGAAARRQ